MGETVKITKGSDWCTLQIAKYCPTKYGSPDKCFLLGEQVRVCGACLQTLNQEEFPHDYEWVLRGTGHEGPCQTVTVDLDEEVVFCPGCLLKVLLQHDPRALDWVLSSHDESHTEPKEEESPRACRDCLLLALYRVDPLFFDLVTTARGKTLVERL